MIPSSISTHLYARGSLESRPDGVRFALKNRLGDATLTQVCLVRINDIEVPLRDLSLAVGQGPAVRATDITPASPVLLPLRETVLLHARKDLLPAGRHRICLEFEAAPFGPVAFTVEDQLVERPEPRRGGIPHDVHDDWSEEIVRERQSFVTAATGATVDHLWRHSFEPALTRGNVESFVGVAQVPVGLAGPLLVRGEHARGEFLIPLATTEGTLVASYNRGMKVLNLAGGVTCTVTGDGMQRAPVFVFPTSREGRAFRDWIRENYEEIKRIAEATSHVAKLTTIEPYLSNNFVYLRFNYTTGDAAGQNMVGKATLAACSWILGQVHDVVRFYLESNLATDKKFSHVNVLSTRGKQVTAEATISRELLERHLRTDPESLHHHASVASLGAFLAGANNNGAHSANGITAMFIATGQDVANVAESSAAILSTDITRAGDLYLSLTLPSLIVATHGGGTGLPTQAECLDILGCRGAGKILKFAEIVAAVALAGEVSLGAAISSFDWVSGHETYGRNR
jgi:hydroxymethylglutaryl-CoA reductase (NADPH)